MVFSAKAKRWCVALSLVCLSSFAFAEGYPETEQERSAIEAALADVDANPQDTGKRLALGRVYLSQAYVCMGGEEMYSPSCPGRTHWRAAQTLEEALSAFDQGDRSPEAAELIGEGIPLLYLYNATPTEAQRALGTRALSAAQSLSPETDDEEELFEYRMMLVGVMLYVARTTADENARAALFAELQKTAEESLSLVETDRQEDMQIGRLMAALEEIKRSTDSALRGKRAGEAEEIVKSLLGEEGQEGTLKKDFLKPILLMSWAEIKLVQAANASAESEREALLKQAEIHLGVADLPHLHIQAEIAALRGDKDTALALLRQMVEEAKGPFRRGTATYLDNNPHFAFLKDTPEFQAILKDLAEDKP